MPEIDFQVNEFRTYEARAEGLSLGFINTGTGAYSPAVGERLQYDGITVILKDGREFTDVPQLRTAIQSGWFVPVGDKVTKYRPKTAGIKVRPTETRGRDPVAKTDIVTEMAEDTEVGSVAARTAHREATNAEAARKVPLESQAAQGALVVQESSSTGDESLDEVVFAIDAEMKEWVDDQKAKEEEESHLQAMLEEQDREAEIRAQAEADVFDLLASIDGDTSTPRKKRAKKKTTKKSARQLPLERQEDRLTMSIVKEEEMENAGTVVGTVGEQRRTVIERNEEFPMNVAPAKPETPAPDTPNRLGGSGALVVDEERDMGQIALSGSSAPIRLEESAQVKPSGTETVRMGDAQVGRQKTAHTVETAEGQEGIAVGRVLSPTTQTFVADDANTSSTAIKRTEEGKQLRVEKFAADDSEKPEPEAPKPGVIATGDVQEAQAGDELTDILPDAATGPEPKPRRSPEEESAYAAVRMLIPDFEWDKDRPVPERAKGAIKHIEDPQFVKGILAVETEIGREEIKKALAAELEKRKEAKATREAKEAEEEAQ